MGLTDHKYAVRVRLVWRGPQESGPGVWRFPARLAEKPGVKAVIDDVVQKQGEGGCVEFDKLSRCLNARLRKYDKEERKRVRQTRRTLETQVDALQRRVMADPGDDELQALRTTREAMLKRYWDGWRNLLQTRTGLKVQLDGEAPTALLSALVRSRKAKTGIKELVRDGVSYSEAKAVLGEATRHFTMAFDVGSAGGGEQYGFLPGKRLTDAVSLVADIIDAAKNKNRDWYLLLIDFEKAYDSVRRDFMLETIAKLGFPPRFVGWIKALHKDVHTRLCVNGWVGEKIQMRKGVRQGCPLAPYLFLCAVEPLSRLVEERKLGIGEEGCERLAYIGYADDTTLLLDGVHQLKEVEQVLKDFADAPGLKFNKGKSALLPLGCNVDKSAPDETEFKWVKKDVAERLLGVWITPGGNGEMTWEKAFDKAAGELSKWHSKYLTTGARVTIINSYVLPVFIFQAQVYPPEDLLWKRVEMLIENFVSGNHADTERHFRLWSGDLIYAPREQGGLGVVDPRGRVDSVALRCVGLALLQGCPLRRGVTESAADLPLGWATLYAHKAVLRGGLFQSRRWAKLCKTVLKSSVVTVPGAASRWDVAGEYLCFNSSIPHRGKAPFGEDELARELGDKKSAEMVLKAFHAAPAQWREWLLAPLMAEEIKGVSPVVSTTLPSQKRCLWEVCGTNGRRVGLQALNGSGERVAWNIRVELRCESVTPVRLDQGRVVGDAGDPRVRLLLSVLFDGKEVVLLRKLREPSKGAEAVAEKRAKWEARAGRSIDWEQGRRVRDSLAVPATARDVLLRVQNLNLQVGERVYFLGGGLTCPHCGGTETLEHCLLECPHILPVVAAVKSALCMMQPGRHVNDLAGLLFGAEETESGFPEATMMAIAVHQIWLGSFSREIRGIVWRVRKPLRLVGVVIASPPIDVQSAIP
ncbi:unnamed protein product [Closterium sp. NIES-65]|nr:unnamed protein product [Closterium sp. NIES-65]